MWCQTTNHVHKELVRDVDNGDFTRQRLPIVAAKQSLEVLAFETRNDLVGLLQATTGKFKRHIAKFLSLQKTIQINKRYHMEF